jgi:hypothetical protein
MKNPLATLPTSTLGWIAVSFMFGAASAAGMRAVQLALPPTPFEHGKVVRIVDLGRLCELTLFAYVESDELSPGWYDAAAAELKTCGVDVDHEPNSRGAK